MSHLEAALYAPLVNNDDDSSLVSENFIFFPRIY